MAKDAAKDLALDILKTCIAGRVRQISRVVSAHYDEALRPCGVTSNQLTILCLLAVIGPSRSVDLEPYLATEQSTLSRNLERMLANGWLEKKPHAQDGRARRLALTREGRQLIKNSYEGWSDAQDWSYELLSKSGAKDIERAAKKLNPMIP